MKKLLPQKLLIGLMIISYLIFVIAPIKTVKAAKIPNASVTLSNPTPGGSSSYTFQYTVPSAGALKEIRMQWATSSVNASLPTGADLTSGSLGAVTNLDGTWALSTAAGATGMIELQNSSTQDLNGVVIAYAINSITNSSVSACDGEASSDTCFIRIQTSTGTGGWDNAVIDETVVLYTVIPAVTVSATIDPIFTFVISSVNASTVVGGVTTSVASTVSSIPFGNLTSGSPKYIAHRLNVTTNANSGYTVTMRMSQAMTGSYTANNIDPFAATGAAWSTPIPWTEPTGTAASVNTGWIGAHTTDTSVSQFDSGEFGPVNSTDNIVMNSTGPDNGLTSVYVNYALEVNVYQPSDIYSGTILYTATPMY